MLISVGVEIFFDFSSYQCINPNSPSVKNILLDNF